MRIKVLHYLNHLGLGGTEKTCQLFFEHANHNEFDVAVAYETKGIHPRLSNFYKSIFICRGKIFGISDKLSLQGVIDDFKPDILHVYQSGYEEFPRPGVHIEVPHFVITNVFGFIDPNIRIDRDIFMSEWLMQYALRRVAPINRGPYTVSPKRYTFVNNPVESPCTNEVFDIHRTKNTIVLGRCGRPDNGIYNSIAVRAAAELKRHYNINPYFIVVAPPPAMLEDLEKYSIPTLMIEPTTDPIILSKFYNSIDIYTHARADGETFGVNIAEAMIHGKPVITHVATPSVPGMGVFQAQTTLVDNGYNGFVVNNNVDEYLQALGFLALSKNLREAFGQNAFNKAMQEFHVDVCMKKLENIYRDVMQNE